MVVMGWALWNGVWAADVKIVICSKSQSHHSVCVTQSEMVQNVPLSLSTCASCACRVQYVRRSPPKLVLCVSWSVFV